MAYYVTIFATENYGYRCHIWSIKENNWIGWLIKNGICPNKYDCLYAKTRRELIQHIRKLFGDGDYRVCHSETIKETIGVGSHVETWRINVDRDIRVANH